jgi:hypothetical protein
VGRASADEKLDWNGLSLGEKQQLAVGLAVGREVIFLQAALFH